MKLFKKKERVGLMNWRPSDGNPFKYECSKSNRDIRFTRPDIAMMNTVEGTRLRTQKELDISVDGNDNIESPVLVKCRSSLKLKSIYELNNPYLAWVLLNFEDMDGKRMYAHDLEVEAKGVICFISYPFGKSFQVKIHKPKKGRFSIAYITHCIARSYGKIYKMNPKKTGLWGHGFSDLYLERIAVFHKEIDGYKYMAVNIGS